MEGPKIGLPSQPSCISTGWISLEYRINRFSIVLKLILKYRQNHTGHGMKPGGSGPAGPPVRMKNVVRVGPYVKIDFSNKKKEAF